MQVILIALSIAATLSAIVTEVDSDTCATLGSDTSLYVRDYDVEESKLAVHCKKYASNTRCAAANIH